VTDFLPSSLSLPQIVSSLLPPPLPLLCAEGGFISLLHVARSTFHPLSFALLLDRESSLHALSHLILCFPHSGLAVVLLGQRVSLDAGRVRTLRPFPRDVA
jgi:hypothetical protein